MSDPSDNPEAGSASGPLAGERLAAARRDQEISLADIARELHLDEAKVQALEQNQFDVLGAPVFAKGHLRKYAELVGVPIDDILIDYYKLNRSAGAPPVVGPARHRSREIDLSRWILPVFVILVVVGAAAWWITAGSPLPAFGGSADSTPDIEFAAPRPAAAVDSAREPGEAAEPAVDEGPTPADTDVLAAGTDTAADSTEAAPDRTAEAARPSAAAAAAPAAGPQVSLTLSYSGDCWTEVTDASGSRLFFDLGRAGSRIALSGEPPLRVLFGDYANVTVEVDGEAFPIPASARRGETARFTINAR